MQGCGGERAEAEAEELAVKLEVDGEKASLDFESLACCQAEAACSRYRR
jgi:hypothetical protein